MPDAPKRQDEPDPFTVEPMDFGLPIDEEKAAREIDMRAEIHGSSPKAWLASERHSELNVQRLYGCRHCGTFAYSPPIAHRVESMGLSCGEEEFVLRPHDLVEQLESLRAALEDIAANGGSVGMHVPPPVREFARAVLASSPASEPPENPRHSDRSYTPNAHDR